MLQIEKSSSKMGGELQIGKVELEIWKNGANPEEGAVNPGRKRSNPEEGAPNPEKPPPNPEEYVN